MAAVNGSKDKNSKDKNRVSARLPATVKPRHYFVKLQPDLKKFVFQGTVIVDIQINEPTPTICLNALELDIQSAVVTQDGAEQRAEQITIQEKPTERATFSFSRPLSVGPAQLIVVFSGILSDKLAGFYRSKYVANGEEKYMATTQFEATDARRAFPCWDEPALKATFDVVVVIPENLLAISNMPVYKTLALSELGLREVHFERTPIMSTYLVALVVSEFDFIEETTPESVVVRVYTPLGKSPQGQFALHVATRALSFFTQLFRIAYPLPKMDLLAIPDFAAGAMENWGCITYREVALLIDPVDSASERRQRVARTVCHEIAHQWFGNLVTMEWWDHLWLSEGFARFLEFYAVADIFPEWDIWAQFILSIHGTAMRHDALTTSHPIEVPVEHPEEINEIFDIISYAKGASVIRMLSDHLGEQTFFAGLNLYLTRHAYKNASTTDLWTAMEEASGKQVRQLMSQWTTQTGYPLLLLTTSPLTQQRYLSSGKSDKGTWRVPIKVLVGHADGTQKSVDLGMLDTVQDYERISAFVQQSEGTVAWLKFNMAQIGFYRVLYPPWLRAKLEASVDKLPPADRLGLLTDAFSLVRSGHIAIDQLFALVIRYKNDRDFAVWSEIASNMEMYCRLFSDCEVFSLLSRFVMHLFTPIKQTLEQHIQKDHHSEGTLMQFYAVVYSILVLVDEPTTIQHSCRLFKSHYGKLMGSPDGELIHPDLRQAVYSAYVQAGDEKEYEQVLRIYDESSLSEERRRCLNALGAAKDPHLLRRTLELGMSNRVRPQDTMFPLGAVALNLNKGRKIAWAFFEEQFTELDRRFNSGGQSFLLSGIVSGIALGLTDDEANHIERFFATHPWPAADNAIRSAIESIRIAAGRINRDVAPMQAWLQTYNQTHL